MILPLRPTPAGTGLLPIAHRAAGFVLAQLIALAAGVAAAAPPAAPGAETGTGKEPTAVVVMYHRFGESKYPSTNTTLEQLDAHIAELTSGKYNVLPLQRIIDAVAAGTPLPARAVGVSIDDAFSSVYAVAWPRFKKAGLPFTMFVATGAIDRGAKSYMSWQQIREMAAAGVAIGSQTETHLHMPDADAERNRGELARSNKRFADELGAPPTLFAYPYGESSLAVHRVVAEAGFAAAFGQHSGAFGPGANRFDLPRFAMNESYGDIDRFRLAVNALPLPVTDVTPADPLVGAANPPIMGFTLTRRLDGIDRLACFASNAGRARVERIGESRIEVRVDTPFPKGRTRINCTFPEGDGRWRWFGRQFYRGE